MKIKFRRAGFTELVQHPKVQANLVRRARAVAAAAGDGFEVREPDRAPRRDRVAVIAATVRANRRNLRDMTLIKALEAGR